MAGFASKIMLRSALVLLAASAVPVHAQDARCTSPDLSGDWAASDGGTYRLRANGSTLWWVGTSGDDGKSWTNVFRGTRSGDVVEGEWVDVRGHGGNGVLVLKISGTTLMEKVDGSGSPFGGTRWDRGACPGQ
jgi:hypothetical protein